MQYFAFFVWIHLTTMSMAQQYEVKDVHELIKIMDKYDAQDIDQLEYNDAIIYELSNGKLILAPGIGPEGILFHDRTALEAMVASKEFPVKGEGGMFEEEQDKIGSREALLPNIAVFQDTLEQVLDMTIDLNGNAHHLDKMTDKISAYGKEAFGQQYFMELGVVFGEMVRRKIEGSWTFGKQYTMNPYYIPSVAARDGYSVGVWKRLREGFEYDNDEVPFSLRRVAYDATHFALMEDATLDPAKWQQAQQMWE